MNVIIRDDLPAAVTLEQMRAATAKDPQLQLLTTAVQRGYMHNTEKVMLKPYRNIFSELSVTQGLILQGSKLVVPEELRAQVITLAHQGHQGIVRTKQFLRATTWFPDMDKLVEEEIAYCLPCQVTVKSPQQEPLKLTKLPAELWDVLATDLHGPLSTGEYLLVVQCLYSRYPAVEIVHSTSADACIPALDKILSYFGIPSEITSDNGLHTIVSSSSNMPNTWVSNTQRKYHTPLGKWHGRKLYEKSREIDRNCTRREDQLAPGAPQVS